MLSHLFHRRPRSNSPAPAGSSHARGGDLQPQLSDAREKAESAAASLREIQTESEVLQELLGRRYEEEATAFDRVTELQGEIAETEAAAESAECNRQEQVTDLRRKSVTATEQVSELRRLSMVRDAELEELRARVTEGAAFREEWRTSEATTERMRVEASCAYRALTDATTRREESLAAAESSRREHLHAEGEVQRLREELAVVHLEAQNREANYWEDARFLMASSDVVDGYETEIARSNEIASEIQAALVQERCLHEEALRDAREAVALGWDMKSSDGGLITLEAGCESGLPEVALDSQTFLTSSPSYLERVPSPRLLSPASPVQSALTALVSENDRLRRKVLDLRGEVEAAKIAPGLMIMQHSHNTSFDSAVAGTGARVVDQMKQALHDDVALLRSLHQVKQELDKERRRERRTRAALERRLAALASGLRPAPPSASKPAVVVHQPVVHEF